MSIPLMESTMSKQKDVDTEKRSGLMVSILDTVIMECKRNFICRILGTNKVKKIILKFNQI